MGEVALLAGAGALTALATGLGAIPVFMLGERAVVLRPLLWGMAVGLMGVASIVGLLLPALDEGPTTAVAAGLLTGAAFLWATRRRLHARDVYVGNLRGKDVRTSVLVFAVLFVHSLPEGLAIGTAWASDTSGLALYIVLAIALQNVPEGTSVAIPMDAAGFGRGAQFWSAVLTSVPQPIGALVAFALVEQVESLLPVSFAFAAGAMLALIAAELAPTAYRRDTWRSAAVGTAVGAGSMLVLSALLGV